MKVYDKYVDNGGVKIHYLDSKDLLTRQKVLIYIPGLLGDADQFRDEMEQFSDYRCLAISLRGCGKSDSPQSGYSFKEQCSDIEAVITDACVTNFSILAYSMGVPYAIDIAKKYSDKVTKVILGDYPAKMPTLSKDWLNQTSQNLPEKGEILKKIYDELEMIDLSEGLRHIKCPVLVIQGKKKGAKLTDKALDVYKNYLSNVTIETFEESGHVLWQPDYQRFIDVVKSFLDESGK